MQATRGVRGSFYGKGKGGSHHIILLFWNFILSLPGCYKILYRITLFTILLYLYLLRYEKLVTFTCNCYLQLICNTVGSVWDNTSNWVWCVHSLAWQVLLVYAGAIFDKGFLTSYNKNIGKARSAIKNVLKRYKYEINTELLWKHCHFCLYTSLSYKHLRPHLKRMYLLQLKIRDIWMDFFKIKKFLIWS